MSFQLVWPVELFIASRVTSVTTKMPVVSMNRMGSGDDRKKHIC